MKLKLKITVNSERIRLKEKTFIRGYEFTARLICCTLD